MTLDLKNSTCDWLVCDCGNTPNNHGYYSCTPFGKIVSPSMTGDKWDSVHVLCMGCNAIYNQDTMEQVGSATHPAVLAHNSNMNWATY